MSEKENLQKEEQMPEEYPRIAALRSCRRKMEELLKQAEELTGEQWMVVASAQEDPDSRMRAAQYRRLAYLQVLEDDLRRIRKKFPAEKIASLSQLGEEYYALRQNGIDPVVACAAVLKSRSSETKPPEMGLLSCRRQDAKEYYTPAEVDRLTEKELKDPAVMAAVRWSMTKWKQR
ncbi:MAG: hypothetical protein IKU72_02010 [Oscillospiraceae bacterium]|nr:hypothetical protein [Oscillospiraceae bacterium]